MWLFIFYFCITFLSSSQVSAPRFKHMATLLIKAAQTCILNSHIYFVVVVFRMEDFFALSKEEAPDNIPMMFITMPSAKDPEAKIRHPGIKIN